MPNADPPSFPRCFGPKENEPLDPNASDSAFRTLREQIIAETGNEITLDDMVSLALTTSGVRADHADLRIRQDRERDDGETNQNVNGSKGLSYVQAYVRNQGSLGCSLADVPVSLHSVVLAVNTLARLPRYVVSFAQSEALLISPKSLGITRVLIHRYSSILSAYGLALADRCVRPFHFS